MDKKYKKYLKYVIRYMYLCVGLLLYAIAFNFFMLPNNFVIGGVSGIAIITYDLFKLDSSMVVFVLSLLLTIIGFILCGRDRMYSSLVSSAVLPFFIKMTETWPSHFNLDISPLVAALYCAVIAGVGLGLVYKVGLSTGGTEIIYWILDKFIKKSTGQLMVIVEGTIIVIGAFATGFQNLLYSLLILFLNSTISDRIAIGISDSKLLFIMPKNYEKVSEYINSLSFVKSVSIVTNDDKKVIYCVLASRDYPVVYDYIKTIDKDVFMSISNTYETIGGIKHE